MRLVFLFCHFVQTGTNSLLLEPGFQICNSNSLESRKFRTHVCKFLLWTRLHTVWDRYPISFALFQLPSSRYKKRSYSFFRYVISAVGVNLITWYTAYMFSRRLVRNFSYVWFYMSLIKNDIFAKAICFKIPN